MKVPIVFSFDDNFALPASIAIKSLVDCAAPGTEYEIHILYDKDLPDETRARIDAICKVNWVLVDDEQFADVPIRRNWNRNTYYRLIVPRLFKQYDKIIWSDVDVLFRGDLSEVMGLQMDALDWAGVAAEVNDDDMVCHVRRPENPNRFIYWPGFMVYNVRRWMERDMTNRCFEVIEKYGERLTFCDLDVLNLVSRDIGRVPLKYCVLESIADLPKAEDAAEYGWLSRVYAPSEIASVRESPVIVHYAGINPKVWNRRREDIPDYYWEYIKGSPFFKRDFYFPSAATNLKSALLFAAYKICPVHSAREALKRKWRGVKWINQYQRSQLRKMEAGNGGR